MADLLPIFPLPNVVLFPNVFLALHIFEPRYKDMVADAVASDRMIGMVLLRPGWETRLRGTPAGVSDRLQRRHHARRAGAGRTVQHRAPRPRALPDRRGGSRAQLSPRRRRTAGRIHDGGRRPRRDSESAREARTAARAGRGEDRDDIKIPSAMSDEDLVHALAQYLDLEPLEKQALLEKDNLRVRAESLVELSDESSDGADAQRVARRPLRIERPPDVSDVSRCLVRADVPRSTDC